MKHIRWIANALFFIGHMPWTVNAEEIPVKNITFAVSKPLYNVIVKAAQHVEQREPSTQIKVLAQNYNDAFQAFLNEETDLLILNEPLLENERTHIAWKHQIRPLELCLGYEALALVVHKNNPISCLSIENVDSLFAKINRRMFSGEISTWDQLGLDDDWHEKTIHLYGQNHGSGAYDLFKRIVLSGADVKDIMKQLPGPVSVLRSIENDPYGIGFCKLQNLSTTMKTISIATQPDQPCIEYSKNNIITEKYPYTQKILVYQLPTTSEETQTLVREFLEYILSRDGQHLLSQNGFYPLHKDRLKKEIKKIE